MHKKIPHVLPQTKQMLNSHSNLEHNLNFLTNVKGVKVRHNGKDSPIVTVHKTKIFTKINLRSLAYAEIHGTLG